MGSCNRLWEIDALRQGRLGEKDAEASERHVRGCDVCAATMARDARLRDLVASLPGDEPSDLRMRRLRARILHDVATGVPGSRPARAPIAVAFALVAALAWVLLHRDARPPSAQLATAPQPLSPVGAAVPDPFAGAIVAGEGARWSRAREGGTERVRLEEGTLDVHVRRQADGERFLVELPDGELEVRGTTFDVSARGGATERVHVAEGVVAVRVRGSSLELTAGQVWPPRVEPKAAIPGHDGATGAPRTAHRPDATAAASESPDAPRARATDDGTAEYAAAIALMQRGQYSGAADAFRAFALAHPKAPQAEDASFLEAASLARAGRPDAAARAAGDHLTRFPASFHRREAAILVARAARDRGDCSQARAVLAPWLGSPPDEEARATLKRCPEPSGE